MFISNSYFLENSAVIYFDFLGEYEVFAKFYFFSSISRIIEVFMNIYNDKIFDHNLCALFYKFVFTSDHCNSIILHVALSLNTESPNLQNRDDRLLNLGHCKILFDSMT